MFYRTAGIYISDHGEGVSIFLTFEVSSVVKV
jgi:hypothetical protein